MEVVYDGIRLTPAEIVDAGAGDEGARDRAVDPVRLAPPLVREVMARMRAEGLDDIPLVVGGIIPPRTR